MIALAAARIVSSSRLISRSAESDVPMSFSFSRRWTRSSSPARRSPGGRVTFVMSRALLIETGAPSLDADGAHFLDVSDAHEHLLDAILLQRVHPLLERDRHDLRDACVLLDELLQRVGCDQQLVQAEPALEAAAAAFFAGLGLGRAVQRELALVVAIE